MHLTKPSPVFAAILGLLSSLSCAGDEFTVVNHLTSVMEVSPAITTPLADKNLLAVKASDGGLVYVDVDATNTAADGRLRLYTMAPNSTLSLEPYVLKGQKASLEVQAKIAYPGGVLRSVANEEQERLKLVEEIAPLYQDPEMVKEQVWLSSQRVLPQPEVKTPVRPEEARVAGEIIQRKPIENLPAFKIGEPGKIRLGPLLSQPAAEAAPIASIEIRTERGVVKVLVEPGDIHTRDDLEWKLATGNITGKGVLNMAAYFYLPRSVKVVDLFKLVERELQAKSVEVRAGNDFTVETSAPGSLFLVLTRDGSSPRIATVSKGKGKYWSGPEPLFGIKEISILK